MEGLAYDLSGAQKPLVVVSEAPNSLTPIRHVYGAQLHICSHSQAASSFIALTDLLAPCPVAATGHDGAKVAFSTSTWLPFCFGRLVTLPTDTAAAAAHYY